MDVVVMHLRADKHMMPDVITDAAAQVFHEVVAAHVVDATAEVAARCWIGGIKASALAADAGHEVRAQLLPELGLEDSVKVIEDGAVGLAVDICSLTGTPCSFKTESQTMMKWDDIKTYVEVGAPLFGG